jgi:hypothetical protein
MLDVSIYNLGGFFIGILHFLDLDVGLPLGDLAFGIDLTLGLAFGVDLALGVGLPLGLGLPLGVGLDG